MRTVSLRVGCIELDLNFICFPIISCTERLEDLSFEGSTSYIQGTSRFLAQGGADAPPWLCQGGAFLSQGRASRFFTNNMIFLECGVIALFEAFYMFRDHNHVKMKF